MVKSLRNEFWISELAVAFWQSLWPRYQAQFVATDLSEKALEVARSNSQLHDVSNRIEFRQGDLLEFRFGTNNMTRLSVTLHT